MHYFQQNSYFNIDKIMGGFNNIFNLMCDLERKASINISVDSVRKRTSFHSSVMSLYETFTSNRPMIGFLVFILIFTIIGLYLVFKKEITNFKLFVYPVFFITFLKSLYMLFGCILISTDIYYKHHNSFGFVFISPFELYNPFVLVLELAVLYLLSEILFSIRKNIFCKIVQFLKISSSILLTILLFVSVVAPEFRLCTIVILFIHGYLVFIIFLPVHIYYICKFGLTIISNSYKFIVFLFKSKKPLDTENILEKDK